MLAVARPPLALATAAEKVAQREVQSEVPVPAGTASMRRRSHLVVLVCEAQVQAV